MPFLYFTGGPLPTLHSTCPTLTLLSYMSQVLAQTGSTHCGIYFFTPARPTLGCSIFPRTMCFSRANLVVEAYLHAGLIPRLTVILSIFISTLVGLNIELAMHLFLMLLSIYSLLLDSVKCRLVQTCSLLVLATVKSGRIRHYFVTDCILVYTIHSSILFVYISSFQGSLRKK